MKQQLKTTAQKIAIIFGLLLIPSLMMQSCKKDDITSMGVVNESKVKELHQAMHKLWSDHMTWTFSTVDAFFNNEAASSSNLDRLLQNQKDIGEAIKPYYGVEAGDALATLLTEHILGAVPVLTAVKEDNTADLETALEDWYENAREIGEFLDEANPYWKEHGMRDMMKMHIDQTVLYSLELFGGNYDQAIEIFEEAHHHMLMMGVDLADGIVIQFPEKF